MTKRVAREPSRSVNLQVLGPDETSILYNVKTSTRFKKLINSYCRQTGLISETLRFQFNGERINENDTPASMNLRNKDVIEVFQLMSGGSNFLDC